MNANAIKILVARPRHTELSLSETNVFTNKVHSSCCKAQVDIKEVDHFFV